MDLLAGLGIDDSTLPFRIAVLEDAWGRSLGIPFDWPMIAAESLAAGIDTPALVSLASAYADIDSITLGELVRNSAASIGLRHPSPEDAIRALGMVVSKAFLDDSITPLHALSIVENLTDHGYLERELFFVYALLYELDDVPHLRDEIIADAKLGARELVEKGDCPIAETFVALTGPTVAR